MWLTSGRTFSTADSGLDRCDNSPMPDPHSTRLFHPRRDEDAASQPLNASGKAIARLPAGGAFFDQTLFPLHRRLSRRQQAARTRWVMFVEALAHSPWDHAGIPPSGMTSAPRLGVWRANNRLARSDRVRLQPVRMGATGFLRRSDNFLMDHRARSEERRTLLDGAGWSGIWAVWLRLLRMPWGRL